MRLKIRYIGLPIFVVLSLVVLIIFIANQVTTISDAEISNSIRKEFIKIALTNGFSLPGEEVKVRPVKNSTVIVLYNQLAPDQKGQLESIAHELSKLHSRHVEVEFR